MDSGSAAAMYDPHAGHRPPGLQGLPPHHSPHMSHAAAAAAAGAVGMHGYHSGHGSAPSHVSPVANHVMGSIPEVHKRDKDAIYGYVLIIIIYSAGRGLGSSSSTTANIHFLQDGY